MGKAIQDKDTQLVYLKERLNMFIEVIDTIEPEEDELEDEFEEEDEDYMMEGDEVDGSE